MIVNNTTPTNVTIKPMAASPDKIKDNSIVITINKEDSTVSTISTVDSDKKKLHPCFNILF